MAEPVSAAVLLAVAHPLRLAVLVDLDGGARAPADLAAAHATTLAVLEPHLVQLRDAGLIAPGPVPGQLTVTTHGWTEIAMRLRALHDARLDPSSEAR